MKTKLVTLVLSTALLVGCSPTLIVAPVGVDGYWALSVRSTTYLGPLGALLSLFEVSDGKVVQFLLFSTESDPNTGVLDPNSNAALVGSDFSAFVKVFFATSGSDPNNDNFIEATFSGTLDGLGVDGTVRLVQYLRGTDPNDIDRNDPNQDADFTLVKFQ